MDNIIHRDFGPAITLRHPFTFRPIEEEYFDNGKRERYGGPAIVTYDHQSGAVTSARYFMNGKERKGTTVTPQREP